MSFGEPWQYEFFRNGIAAATLAGALCALVGVYVVLRHMSYIGHGLSHAIFGGAVVSYVSGVNYYLGAGLWGVASALLIGRVARRRQIGADAAIGIVTTASFAIGVALISRGNRFNQNFEAVLFGNVLAVNPAQVLVLAGTAGISCLAILALYRQLMFMTFDPEVAPVYGVRSGLVDGVFTLVLAATIITTMQVLGVTLIAAALVIPPVVARMLSDSFKNVLLLSVAIGALCGFVGMYASYFLNIASGPTIVLTAASVFGLVYAYSSMRKWRDRPGRGRGADRSSSGREPVFQ
ncbi:MAG: metal ABC transporter permease [Acidobacteria bacterium]|nr:MAG: metal ABC transporter permease [Acidobacteriota bacterium]